jgi:hypothetical protein
MATYALDLSDGSQISVDAPSGATNEELLKLVKKQRREARDSKYQTRKEERDREFNAALDGIVYPEGGVGETGMFADLAKGFGAGFVGTGEMAALGAATLLDEETEVVARDKIQGIADAIKPSGGDTDDLSYKIGQTFGSIAGFAAPIAGVAAGIAALPVAAPAAAVATGAGALLGVGTAAGEASERARAAGATEEQRNRAIRQAAPFGLLEVAPLGRFMKSVDIPVINKLIDDLGPETVETIGQRIQNAAITGGAEGAQEATAEIVQNLAERGYNPERAIFEGSGESAALGGGAGATIQFLVDAFTNSRKTGPVTETSEVLALPPPSEAELRMSPKRGISGPSTPSGEQINMPPPPKQITGPDDLGLRNEAATGVPTTRDQRTARTSEGIASLTAATKNKAAVVEQAKAELQNDGMITPKTRKEIEANLTPKEAEDALKNTRYEPILSTLGQGPLAPAPNVPQDNRPFGDVQRDLVPPKEIQDRQRFDDVIASQKRDSLSPDAERSGRTASIAVEEQAAQARARERQGLAAAERGDVEAFEQPDLFAMEREQDERKYGRPTPQPEAAPEMLGPIDSGRAANPETDLVDRIAALEAQEASANVRKATRREQENQEAIDVDTELGLRDMQAKVTEPARRTADRERPEQLSFRGDLRQGVREPQLNPNVEPVDFASNLSELSNLGEGQQDADAQPTDAGASRTSDAGVRPKRKSRRGAKAPADTGRVKPSDSAGVGQASGRASKPSRRARESDDTLKTNAASKKPAEFNRDAVGGKTTGAAGQVIPGVARSKTTNKKISADTKERFAPKPQRKTSNQQFADQSATSAKKGRAETVRSKEADVAHKARFEAQPKAIQDIGKDNTELNVPDAPMTASDKNKILKLLNDKRKTGTLLNAARKYFDSFPTFTGAIDALTYDVGMKESRSRRSEDYTKTTAQEQFYLNDKSKSMPSMGKESARHVTNWMTKDATGMSPKFVKYVKKLLQYYSDLRAGGVTYSKTDKVADAVAKLSPEALAIRNAALAKDAKKPLLAEATLDIPLRPIVKAMLLKGDLSGALSALGLNSPSPLVQRLATKLGKNIGATKLTTAAKLKTPDGVPVSGYFDPKTNTITLDKTSGINAHTLLHEMVHAVTSATLANKSHPLTKQLTKIFEDSKELLAGEYGVTNLDEFVAEAMSNPDFQTQLKTSTINGRHPFYQMARAVANFIRTLIGRPTVPEQSTFDAVDTLVQSLISPTLEGRNASKMYMMSKTVAGAKTIINNLADKTIEADNKYIDATRDLIGDVPRNARKVFLKFMPVNVLGKLARSKIAEAPVLNNIVNSMSNALREANDKLRPLVEDIRELKKSKTPKDIQDYATLSYLIPNASFYRIDPREPNFKKAYSIKKDPKTRLDAVEAKKIHDELRKQFTSMSPKAQKLYRTITNMFESRLLDSQSAIDEAIAASIPDEEGRKSASKKLAELLEAERGQIRPFAPLTRSGNYRLEFMTIDPVSGKPEYYIEYFDGVTARERAKKNLAEYNAKVRAKLPNTPEGNAFREYIDQPVIEGVRGANFNFNKAPNTSFVYALLQQLQAAGIKPETYDGVVELVLDSMPERSFMQSFRKRGDKRGFQGDTTPTGMAQTAFDLLDTVQTKGRDYNRQIIQMQYGSKIQKWKVGVNDKYKTEKLDETTADYKKTLIDIADFAQSPNVARWSQNLTSFGYAWTMGFNLSSAATAIFDVPMSGAPRLMGKYGDAKAIKALGSAAALLKNSPKEKLIDAYSDKVDADGKVILEKRKIKGGMAGFSIVNYDFDAIRNMSDAELKKEGMTKAQQKKLLDLEMLAEVGSENAQFSQSLNQEHMDVTRGKDRLEMLNAYTSFLFHHSERYSREVLMASTYELELDRLRNNPKPAERNMSDSEKQRAAALEAVNETETTLGATASAGRPVIAQSGVGNVFMLFKRFAISKYAMMAEMTNDAFKGATTDAEKQDRAIARGQLGRFMVSSAGFAGVAGMPMMGALGMLYDIFSEDDDDNFDAVLDKTFGETLSRGLLNAALGSDMGSRIEMNSLLYRPPIIDKDQSMLWTLAEQLGGPVVGISLSIERGIGLYNEGEFVRGTEAVLPASIRNVIKSGRYATEGALTRRGDPISEDIGLFQTIMQAGGAAPTAITDQHRRNKNNRGRDDHLKEKRTRLLRKLNFTAAQNDAKGYLEAYKEILKYNRSLPLAARERKVILKETIDRSRKAYDARTLRMKGGIEYSPFMLASNREYDDGLFD